MMCLLEREINRAKAEMCARCDKVKEVRDIMPRDPAYRNTDSQIWHLARYLSKVEPEKFEPSKADIADIAISVIHDLKFGGGYR